MERRVSAAAVLHVPFEDACAVLVDDPAAALSPRTHGAARRGPVFSVDLDVARGGASAAHAVELALGPMETTDEAASFPVAWHASSHRRLLPAFSGKLVVRDGELVLEGSYRPPLRALGMIGDRLAGSRVAGATLLQLVTQVARRLDAEVARRLGLAGFRPAAGGDASPFWAR